MPSILYELKVDDLASEEGPRMPLDEAEVTEVRGTRGEYSVTSQKETSETQSAAIDDEDEDVVVSGDVLRAELRAISASANGGKVSQLPTAQGMDWGTIAIYSCSDSCDLSNEEQVVVQGPVH